MTVYLDLVILLNFLVDWLLFLGTNRLTGHPPGWKRGALAAVIGGIYAGVCMIPQGQLFGGVIFRTLSLGVMAVVAFGWNLSALRRGTVFVLLNMALGGIAMGLNGSNFIVILLAAGGVAALCHFGFKNPLGAQEFREVELVWHGKKVKLTALVDTGNTLRDPISGASVLVAGADVAEMLGIPYSYVKDPFQGVLTGALTGARLIPYKSVGNQGGMLLGVRCEQVRLNGKETGTLVAFATESLGRAEGYQALVGGV